MGSKAGALKQMLLDILEDTHEIRRICIMGRNCTLSKTDDMECSVPLEKEIAEGKSCTVRFTQRSITSISTDITSVCTRSCLSIGPCVSQKRKKRLKCFWKIISKGNPVASYYESVGDFS